MEVILFRLLFAQSLDAATFVAFYLMASPETVHAERNPLILAIMALGGIAMVGVVKMVIVSIAVYRSSRPPSKPIVHRWYMPMRTIIISAAAASGIVGAGFNLGSILSNLGLSINF